MAVLTGRGRLKAPFPFDSIPAGGDQCSKGLWDRYRNYGRGSFYGDNNRLAIRQMAGKIGSFSQKKWPQPR